MAAAWMMRRSHEGMALEVGMAGMADINRPTGLVLNNVARWLIDYTRGCRLAAMTPDCRSGFRGFESRHPRCAAGSG